MSRLLILTPSPPPQYHLTHPPITTHYRSADPCTSRDTPLILPTHQPVIWIVLIRGCRVLTEMVTFLYNSSIIEILNSSNFYLISSIIISFSKIVKHATVYQSSFYRSSIIRFECLAYSSYHFSIYNIYSLA